MEESRLTVPGHEASADPEGWVGTEREREVHGLARGRAVVTPLIRQAGHEVQAPA